MAGNWVGIYSCGVVVFCRATALAPASYPPDRHLPRVRKTASCTHCYFHKRLAFALLSYTRCSAACFALGASGTVVGCVVAEYISRIADCLSISPAGQRRHPCSLASAVSVQTLGAVALAAITFCTSLIHVVRHASRGTGKGIERPLVGVAPLSRVAPSTISRLHSALNYSLTASGFWARACWSFSSTSPLFL